MKILITGGSGMVGRNIVEFLKKKGFDVLYPTSHEIDLLEKEAFKNYIIKTGPEMIIHCAGKVGGIQANIKNPISFMYENTQLSLNILISSYEAGIKNLINLGSSCMYPKNIKNPLSEDSILSGRLEPTNEGYAMAKLTSTKLCEYINKENVNFKYKTIIPCNLYGKYDKFDSNNSHMIPAVIKKIHEAKIKNLNRIDMWGDGQARREFMYVEDLADFIYYAIQKFELLPQNMNVGLGYDFTVDEYYKKIAEVIGYNGEFNYDLSKPVGMKQKLLNNRKQIKFGWKYKTSLLEGIQKTYDYYLNEN